MMHPKPPHTLQSGKPPFFSIVVPTWNRGEIIRETIDSLLNQNFPRFNYEVIVVDDGSTDDTPGVLEEYSNYLTIYRQKNSGPAAARNLGLQQAKGSYVVCFDSDDILLPDALGVYKAVIDAFMGPPLLIAQQIRFHQGQHISFPDSSAIRCIKCKDYFSKKYGLCPTSSMLWMQSLQGPVSRAV